MSLIAKPLDDIRMSSVCTALLHKWPIQIGWEAQSRRWKRGQLLSSSMRRRASVRVGCDCLRKEGLFHGFLFTS